MLDRLTETLLHEGGDYKMSLETSLLERYLQLILEQSGADWSVLCQFRLRVMPFTQRLLESAVVRPTFPVHSRANYVQALPQEHVSALVSTYFWQRQLKESMMRGAGNKAVVLK